MTNFSVGASRPKAARKLSLRFNSFVRWTHVYVSMGGFLAMIFFAFTGITLNHPTWFGGESETSSTLKANMPLAWVAFDEPDGDNVSETSSAEAQSLEPGLDQLKIAEYLRDKHHLRGMVKEFRIDEEECSIAYKGPGYSADVFIDRRTGEYELSLIQHGTIGKWNDLHKGRDSGIPWSIMIDVSAIVMIISAATGLAMLFFLKRKRTSGLASALCGALIFAAFYVFFIP